MVKNQKEQREPIVLTEEGIAAALQFQAEDPVKKDLALRLYIEGKGCDGFYYGVSFDTPSPDDLHFQQGPIDLVVDPETYLFCAGSVIEWVDDERGKGFLVENPQHRKFRGKFYKRKDWRERLESRSASEPR